MSDPDRQWFVRAVLAAIVALVFAWAAAHHALQPVPLARVVAFLMPASLAGHGAAVTGAITVSALEAALAAALILFRRERWPLVAALGLLAIFSAAILVLAGSQGAPRCGCLSTAPGLQGPRDTFLGLVRNSCLMWLAGWLLVAPDSRRVRPHPAGRNTRAAAGRGASLVELLAVIVIIGIIIALALPALGRMRAASRASMRLQTISHLGHALHAYAQDYHERFPYFATPRDPLGPIVMRGVEMPRVYFQTQRWYWASAIVPEYADLPRRAIEPQGRAEYLQGVLGFPPSIIASTYLLTSTACAAPRYWRSGPFDPDTEPGLYTPTSQSAVLMPSRKGLLLADLTGPGGHEGQEVFPVSMGDGSVFPATLRDFEPDRAVSRPFGCPPWPVIATRDGLAGWDF